jgi:diguanylate cyclase (GGDEF)-like protein
MSVTTSRQAQTLAAALAVGCFALVLLARIPTPHGALLISNLGQCLAPMLAAVACWRASGRAEAVSHHWAWRFLGCAAISWAAGQLVWTLYFLSGTAAPYSSIADVGYLLAVPFFLAGVWRFARVPSGASRMVAVVDGFLISTGLFAISWPLVLGPSWRAGADSTTTLVLSLAYPVGNLVVASSVLLVIVRVGPHRSSVPLHHVASALLLLVAADSLFVLNTVQGVEGDLSPSDVGWVAGWVVLFLAASAFPRLVEAQVAGQRSAAAVGRAALPFSVIGAALVVRVGLLVAATPTDTVLAGATAAMIVLVMARQLLTMRENEHLTQALEDRLHELTSREEQLRHQASHDGLTGLANRWLFTQRVDRALARGARRHMRTVVLFVDLDDFKTVNDSLGHAIGDRLLVEVGARLTECVRGDDLVARLGGDEYGILLEHGPSVDRAEQVAVRVLDALDGPFTIDDRRVFTAATIGIAEADGAAVLRSVELLADADVALYAAKEAGKGTFRHYQGIMRVAALDRLELGQDMRSATVDDELRCHYQPIVDVDTGLVVALEALVRWEHPRRGLLDPQTFIELAEETGTIVELGRRVLELSVAEAAGWCAAGVAPPGLELHVNLSGRQLEDPGLTDDVARVLSTTGFPASQLVLEITESVAVEGGARHAGVLAGLRALGVRLAIDDFGTGYSSLNYLRSLPVQILKIDRAFAETSDGGTDAVLLEAIVRLGQALDLELVAEGIEREDQVETLRRLGCRRAQGYLYHRPAPAADVPAFFGSAAATTSPSGLASLGFGGRA